MDSGEVLPEAALSTSSSFMKELVSLETAWSCSKHQQLRHARVVVILWIPVLLQECCLYSESYSIFI